MKILRNTVITLLILLSIFIGSGFLISHYYGDEVKKAVIHRLNQKLKVEVDVEEVSFSVLRKFPYASVGLDKAVLTKEKDTLFHFDKIFLQFDIVDLFRGQQKIDRVSFEDGSFRLPVDANGNHPYSDMWQAETETEDTSSRFELDRLTWEQVRFYYNDQRSGTSFQTDISYAFLQGDFKDKKSELRTRIEGTWNSIDLGERSWTKMDRPYNVEASGKIHNEEKKVEIQKGELRWNGLQGKVDGTISYGAGSRLDLAFRTPYQASEKYMNAWPNLLIMPEGYRTEAQMRVEGAWEGPTGKGAGPVLKGNMELKDGKIRHKSSGIEASKLKAKGSFRTRNKRGRPIIRLKSFSGELGGGEWKGKGHWSPGGSGEEHRLKVHLNGKSRVKETVRFLGIDTLRKAEGKWEASLRVQGALAAFRAPTPGELERASISGRAELKDATLAVKGNDKAFRNVSGTFLLHGMDAAVEDLEGKLGGSKMKLKGRFYELLPYLFLPHSTLRINAELSSPSLNLDRLLEDPEGSSSKNSSSYNLSFPEDLRFDLKADIDELKFRRFNPSDLKGRIELGPGGLQGRGISMRIAQGRLNGNMSIDASRSPYEARAGVNLKGIHIRPFFRAFENFGQELVRHEHLKGVIDADIRYSSSLQKNLTIPPKSVLSTVKLEFRKGELIRFEPLMDLGEKLAEKKVLNSFLDLEELSKELKHVRFKTLKNRFRIEDEELIIPRFDVRSNALDITATGKQGFDGKIDHHFEILLDDLLTRSEKSEFGYIKDEGRKKRLFVKMTGNSENPDLSFDRQAASEFRQKRREKEKESVKDALRKEFGLFGGKDSLSTDSTEKEEEKSDPVFDVKWGDEKKKEKEQEKKEKEKSFWEQLGIGDDEEKEEKESDK